MPYFMNTAGALRKVTMSVLAAPDLVSLSSSVIANYYTEADARVGLCQGVSTVPMGLQPSK